MRQEPMPTEAGTHTRRKPALQKLPDTPNTRRLAQAMRAATIRYDLLARTIKESSPRS
jgi:hypothetical protein